MFDPMAFGVVKSGNNTPIMVRFSLSIWIGLYIINYICLPLCRNLPSAFARQTDTKVSKIFLSTKKKSILVRKIRLVIILISDKCGAVFCSQHFILFVFWGLRQFFNFSSKKNKKKFVILKKAVSLRPQIQILICEFWLTEKNIQNSQFKNQDWKTPFFEILEDKVVQGKKCTCQFGLGLSSL